MNELKPNHLYKILSFGPIFWYASDPKLTNFDRKIDSKYSFQFLGIEYKSIDKTNIIKILTKDGIGYIRIDKNTIIEEQ